MQGTAAAGAALLIPVSVCSIFWCPDSCYTVGTDCCSQLPALGIFKHAPRCWCMRLHTIVHRGCTDTIRKSTTDTIRKSALEADWAKTPLPHRGLKPASVLHACQSVQFTSCCFFIMRGEIIYGHLGKLIQENIIFMRFCCCFKLSKKIEKLSSEQPTHTIAKCTPSAIG